MEQCKQETIIDTHDDAIEAHEADILELKSRVTDLERGSETRGRQLDAIQGDVTDILSNIATMKTEEAVKAQVITVMQTDLAEMKKSTKEISEFFQQSKGGLKVLGYIVGGSAALIGIVKPILTAIIKAAHSP